MIDWTQEKVVVLAGGMSCEKEISLISGQAVLDALLSKNIPTVLIDPAADFTARLKKESPTIVFLALHGTFGEDGSVQKILEDQGMVYTGSGIETSRNAFDKSKAQKIFQNAGIKVPEFAVILKKEISVLPKNLSFPVVVKPASAGSSVGISIVFDRSNFLPAVKEAFRYSDTVLVDRYISGRELTVGFLGNAPLPIVEVIPQRKFYDYQAKYKDGGTRYEFPAKLTPQETKKVADLATSAVKVAGCEVMARVDLILADDGQPYVLEVNTIPGLTGKSLLPKAASAAGIDFSTLCVRILDLSLEARRYRGSRLLPNEKVKI